MASTRQLIIDHLRHRSPITAAELSRTLGLTTANIRHHLSILIKQGSVAELSGHPATGRGRPAYLYALAIQVYSHNLDGLSAALLEAWVSHQPDSNREDNLRNLAHHLAPPPVHPQDQSTLTRRLNLAVRHLNEMNYEARWEARTRAPQLILSHCPYAAILDKHPELCQMDAYLLEDLLTTQVTQTEKLQQDQTGRMICRFILRFKEEHA